MSILCNMVADMYSRLRKLWKRSDKGTVGGADLSERVPQLTLIHAEVEAQIGSYERRSQAMDSRASVLIAASALATTLLADWDGNGWMLLAIVCALAGAVLGLIAMAPRYGSSLKPASVRAAVGVSSEAKGLLWLIDHKIELLTVNEKRLSRRGRLLQAGFMVFVASIGFMMLSATPLSVSVTN